MKTATPRLSPILIYRHYSPLQTPWEILPYIRILSADGRTYLRVLSAGKVGPN